MSFLLDVGRRLPEPIKKIAASTMIAANRFRGETDHIEYWNGYQFRFGYWDRRTFGTASQMIQDGEIGHEKISLEHFKLPEWVDGCLDIGAHFGAYTVPLGVMNQSIPIHAFEPEPYNLRVLNRNLILNDLKGSRFETHKSVVSNYNGITTFYRDISATGPVAGTTQPVDNDAEYEGEEFEVISVADFCVDREMSNPWIKIDAEGEELNILKSLISADEFESVCGLIELHLNRDDITRERFHEMASRNSLDIFEVKERLQNTNPAFLFATEGASYW